ncbi:hypothetical protein GQ53DRAFT_858041 [Thozetella sp. PMI_491]|nr:hypothetical protein GQ53DRAFT_858041 [Thozetella sp. PMI_491]
MAITVLTHVPEPEQGYALLREPKPMDTWIHIIARRILGSLYREFGAVFGKNRSQAQLEWLAHKICMNCTRCVSDNTNGPDEWLAQFEGPNLRWESLADPERKLPDIRPLYDYYFPAAHECLVRCIELSQEFCDSNVILLYLHYRQTNLESLVSGEAGRQVWRSHATTVSAVTFFGLHAETDGSDYRPTLQSEAKRRVLAAVIDVDKELAAFTGRMPLLSHAFTTKPLPLDLKDEYLFMDEETLFAKAQETLDSRGWNTEGGIYSATYLRGGVILSRLREQVIEIALGHAATKLKALQEETIAEFPGQLVYSPADLLDPAVGDIEIQARLSVRFEKLQNEFYMDRLLLRKGHVDDGTLLNTSFELISAVITLWTNAHRFVRNRANLGWTSICYGAPAGAILCKELLRPTLSGLHPKNPAITRSSIIQKLSLFVGCLEWVTMWGSNRELCRECKSVIQRVLDHALNATGAEQQMTGLTDWDLDVPLDFNFDLLEAFDYLRPDTQA